MMIEVKWAEPKGQPEELLLNLDEIAYCNKEIIPEMFNRRGEKIRDRYIALHVQLKSGTDLMLADGEKLYNFIKDYNKIKVDVE